VRRVVGTELVLQFLQGATPGLGNELGQNPMDPMLISTNNPKVTVAPAAATSCGNTNEISAFTHHSTITWTPADRDYKTLRIDMQTLFTHLGITTAPPAAAWTTPCRSDSRKFLAGAAPLRTFRDGGGGHLLAHLQEMSTVHTGYSQSAVASPIWVRLACTAAWPFSNIVATTTATSPIPATRIHSPAPPQSGSSRTSGTPHQQDQRGQPDDSPGGQPTAHLADQTPRRDQKSEDESEQCKGNRLGDGLDEG